MYEANGMTWTDIIYIYFFLGGGFLQVYAVILIIAYMVLKTFAFVGYLVGRK